MDAISISRRLVAKAIGTAFLLAAIVGSGIMAQRLAGGNQVLELLCNSLPIGAILVVLIGVFGGISGAHFNPAVTASFLARREITVTLAIAYVVVQIAAGIGGTWAAHLMFQEPVLQFSDQVRAGPAQWFAEGVATFGLLMTVFGTMRWRADAVPFTVGLYIFSAQWFTASTSFANPAVTIARSFTDTYTGIEPVDGPAFIVAQFVGALLATALAAWMFAPVASQAQTHRAKRHPRVSAPAE